MSQEIRAMTAHSIGTKGQVELTEAILIYGGRAATLHSIEITDRGPALLQGKPVTPEHLRLIVRGLSEEETKPAPAKGEEKRTGLLLGLLPSNVIFADVGRLMFWVPASRQALKFTKRNKEMSGKLINHPALLFSIEVRGVYCFALASNGRPSASTKLYQAPYYNINNAGSICIGTAPFPRTPHPKFIDQCLEAFFSTNFTHQTSTRKLVAGKKKYASYLRAMRRVKSKPKPWLYPLGLTLGDFIEGRSAAGDQSEGDQPVNDMENV